MVRVRAEGNPRTFLASDLEEAYPQVLTVGVSVDLHGLVEARGFTKDPMPIRSKPLTPVIHAGLGMAQDLDIGISQAGNITLCLILLMAEG